MIIKVVIEFWQSNILGFTAQPTLAGIGLFALGAYYLCTGHGFFHQTHRENLRDAIEESEWLNEERFAMKGSIGAQV